MGKPRAARVVRDLCGIIPSSALCAIARDRADYMITPFGHLAPGNPYEAYEPPLTDPDPGEPAPARE